MSKSGPLATHVPDYSGSWRLERPSPAGGAWKLHGPLWRGGIELASADLFAPRKIRIAALEQRGVYLPPSFDREWLQDRCVVDPGKHRMVRQPPLLEMLLEQINAD